MESRRPSSAAELSSEKDRMRRNLEALYSTLGRGGGALPPAPPLLLEADANRCRGGDLVGAGAGLAARCATPALPSARPPLSMAPLPEAGSVDGSVIELTGELHEARGAPGRRTLTERLNQQLAELTGKVARMAAERAAEKGELQQGRRPPRRARGRACRQSRAGRQPGRLRRRAGTDRPAAGGGVCAVPGARGARRGGGDRPGRARQRHLLSADSASAELLQSLRDETEKAPEPSCEAAGERAGARVQRGRAAAERTPPPSRRRSAPPPLPRPARRRAPPCASRARGGAAELGGTFPHPYPPRLTSPAPFALTQASVEELERQLASRRRARLGGVSRARLAPRARSRPRGAGRSSAAARACVGSGVSDRRG